ncbi:MAG: ABA4-like family protein [Bacteroidota bacterium]
MELQSWFSLVNTLILLPWALMLFLPKWKWTKTLIYSYIFQVLLGILYLVWFGMNLSSFDLGAFSEIDQLAKAFSNPELAFIGWIHYLAFDLFVGAWILKDGQEKSIAHWKLIPCLLFSFMMGPVGLLLYLGLRASVLPQKAR